MKKLIKLCALGGLVLFIAGVISLSASAALGGRHNTHFPSRILSHLRHSPFSWVRRWGNELADEWFDLDEEDLGRIDPLPETALAKDNALPVSPKEIPAPSVPQPGQEKDTPNPPDGQKKEKPEAPKPGDEPKKDGSNPQADPYSRARKLEIDVHSGVIEISERSDVSQIQVNISDPLNATQCFMDEDTLEISRETGGHHRRRDGSGNRNDTPVIEIILPKDHSIFQLSLDLGTAACTVSDLTVSELDIEAGIGSVSFSGSVNGNIDVETGTGTVALNLAQAQTDYNYRAECGPGSIEIGSESYSMLSDDTYINNNAPYTMDLECGIGTIQVTFGNMA